MKPYTLHARIIGHTLAREPILHYAITHPNPSKHQDPEITAPNLRILAELCKQDHNWQYLPTSDEPIQTIRGTRERNGLRELPLAEQDIQDFRNYHQKAHPYI